MSQVCGSSRSLANQISSGGSKTQPSPRHGSPPMSFTPSQAMKISAAKATKIPTRRGQPRSGDRGIGDLERAIDDPESFRQLLLGDDERRVGEEGVPAHEGVEALLTEALAQRHHLVAGAIEGRHRLHGGAVAHELDDAEHADAARRSDARVARGHLLEMDL